MGGEEKKKLVSINSVFVLRIPREFQVLLPGFFSSNYLSLLDDSLPFRDDPNCRPLVHGEQLEGDGGADGGAGVAGGLLDAGMER